MMMMMMTTTTKMIMKDTVWNALPDYLRNPTLSVDVFKRYLKTLLFAQY